MNQLEHLIQELQDMGITDPSVLAAIKKTPREQFVLPPYIQQAYDNTALPIDCEQTISQPYIVALMTQALRQGDARHKILEIGTGSGYQTAILAQLFDTVWTIERIPALLNQAKVTLDHLGFNNIHYHVGNGTEGWEAASPFDGIVITAAAESIPPALLAQMAPDKSAMVLPVGDPLHTQRLLLLTQTNRTLSERHLSDVRFVPLIKNDWEDLL